MIILRRTLKSPSFCNSARYFGLCTAKPKAYSGSDIPSTTYYDDLINKAGHDRDFNTVQILLDKRHRDGFFNTNRTFKFVSTDLSVLDDLLESLSGVQKGFPRKNTHDNIIAHLSKMGRTDEAERVVDIMLERKYGANAVTFHPILNAVTRKRRFNEAWRLVNKMKTSGIKPDITAYNYLLTAYCFKGELASAAELLTKMEMEEGMVADTRTYDALVLGACKGGKIDGAVKILRRMVDDGVVPVLYSTYAHVINMMLKYGYYLQAMDFVMSFAGRDLGADSENFGVLADRMIGLNKLDEAKLLLKEMKKRRLRMGDKLKNSYNSLVTDD